MASLTKNNSKMTEISEFIALTESKIRKDFENEGTGHDWWHIDRVRNIAVTIAKAENANIREAELGALLHDIADHKAHNNNLKAGPQATEIWLESISAPEDLIKRMSALVSEISFKGAKVDTPVSSLETACVQDADRLDAIGALGIARAFSFGGAHSRLLHHPDFKPTQHESFSAYATDKGPTIAHFYEKLLLLKDRMQTKTGQRMAEQRHQFMEAYLEQFFAEWDGLR